MRIERMQCVYDAKHARKFTYIHKLHFHYQCAVHKYDDMRNAFINHCHINTIKIGYTRTLNTATVTDRQLL